MSSLILASQSPRRRELLKQLGYQFRCENADIDESILTGESPADYVQRVAVDKVKAIAKQSTGLASASVILGADTSVVVDDEILGKPLNFQHFKEIILQLSGREHTVYTALAAIKNTHFKTQLITTKVTFKTLSLDEIHGYWQSGEPQDKAGGYGIQGIGGQFITRIEGSYSAVVGLPLYETAELLSEFGIVNPLITVKEVNK